MEGYVTSRDLVPLPNLLGVGLGQLDAYLYIGVSVTLLGATTAITGLTTTTNYIKGVMDNNTADVWNISAGGAFMMNNLKTINISSGNFSFLTSINAEMTSLTSASIFGNSLTYTNGVISNGTISNLVCSLISTTNLQYTNTTSTNINNTNLTSTNINNVNLTTSNLISTSSSITNIYNTNLTSTNINNTNLTSTNINNTNISASNLVSTSSSITNIYNTNLTTATLNFLYGYSHTNDVNTYKFLYNKPGGGGVINYFNIITNGNFSMTNINDITASFGTFTNNTIINSTISNLVCSLISSTNTQITNLTSASIYNTNLYSGHIYSNYCAVSGSSSVNNNSTNSTQMNIYNTNLTTSNILCSQNIICNGTGPAVYLNDSNKGMWYSGGQNSGAQYFASTFPTDGIAVFGWSDGTLGTRNGGNKNVLTWNNSGNVGIGKTNQSYPLDVNGNINSTGLISTNNTLTNIVSTLISSTNAQFTNLSSTNIYFTNSTLSNLVYTNSTITNLVSTKITATNINVSSNVGIGTNPLYALDVYDSVSIVSHIKSSGTDTISKTENKDGNSLYLGCGSSASVYPNMVYMDTNGISKFCFSSNITNIGMNTTSPNFLLDINGTANTTNLIGTNSTISNMFSSGITTGQINMTGNMKSANTMFFYPNASSTSYLILDTTELRCSLDNQMICGSTSQRWVSVAAVNGTIQTSDISLKNYTELSYGLKDVLKIKTIKYSWKNSKDTHEYYGLDADNLRTIFKELVYDEDPKLPLQLNYSEIIPVLVNSIKELNTRIEVLETSHH